jgi:4'-phosphopantetheinyl transferase
MEVYWLARKSADVPMHDRWLSAREGTTLARLHETKRRAAWRLGRWTAKTALATRQELGESPEALADIEVRTDEYGAPGLFHWGQRASYSMSLSHSYDVAVCVLAEAGALLGCDLELVEPRSPAFLAKYLNLSEQICIPAREGFERDAIGSVMWSAKESVLKALGCGMTIDLLRLSVRLDPVIEAGRWSPLAVSPGCASPLEGWWRIYGGFAWTVVPFPASPAPCPL